MKKFKIILFLFAITLISCETHDDFDSDRQTIIGFTTAVGSPNVSIPAGDSVEKEYNVFISDVSNESRTFSVVVDPSSVISPENFDISDVVIPAGTRQGIFTVTVTNVSLPTEYAPAVFAFDNSNPNYVSGGKASLNMRTAP